MISIIVPVYNVEKYLDRCIQSILNQTYKNYELILIDDGSSDHSSEICDSYANNYQHIKVIHKKNEGLGLTRNVGITNANGNYIMFIDSDDTIHPDLLKVCNEELSKGYDTIIFGYNRINENDQITSTFQYEDKSYKGKEIKVNLLPKLIGSSPSGHDSIAVSACGVLYSKDIISKNKLMFKSERKIISEDLIWNLEYLIRSQSVKISNKSFYNYRFTEGSLTKKYIKNRFCLVKDLYNLEIDYLEKYGILAHTEIRLKKQFFIYLRMCFRQEDTAISKLTLSNAIINIGKICSDPLVITVINSYPVKELQFKQKTFVYLVKYKCAKLIYFCVKLGLIA